MSNLAIKNKTMSSTQLSVILPYARKEINKKVRAMFGEKVAGEKFSPDFDPQNRAIDYHLPEKESKMFVAKHDINFLEQVIQFWIDKEPKKVQLLSLEEMTLQVISGQQAKIESQQKTIEVKNDLIIASNEASIKAGEILVRDFVKSVDCIEIGEKLFYQWMRDRGYLLKESRQPYQQYVNRGDFTWRPSKEKYGGKPRHTLLITPRGKVWLTDKYLKYLNNNLEAA